MPGTLYLAIDFFVPGLIRPVAPPDDYSHDLSTIHLIIQPMLLDSKEADVEALDAKTYLTTWTAEDLKNKPPILIGQSLGDRINAGKISAIPVPFPAATN